MLKSIFDATKSKFGTYYNKVSQVDYTYYSDDSKLESFEDDEYMVYYVIISILIGLLFGYYAINKMFSGEKANKAKVWVYVLIFINPNFGIMLFILAYLLNLTVT
jgi:hypothetical protein